MSHWKTFEMHILIKLFKYLLDDFPKKFQIKRKTVSICKIGRGYLDSKQDFSFSTHLLLLSSL